MDDWAILMPGLLMLCCMEGADGAMVEEDPIPLLPTGLKPGIGTEVCDPVWVTIIPECMDVTGGTGVRGPIEGDVPNLVCMDDSRPCHSFNLSACFLRSSSFRASSLRISTTS